MQATTDAGVHTCSDDEGKRKGISGIKFSITNESQLSLQGTVRKRVRHRYFPLLKSAMETLAALRKEKEECRY